MATKILFVGHDANRAGAQLVLLHWLKAEAAKGRQTYLLLEKGGDLLNQYERYARVWVWRKGPSNMEKIYKKIPFLKREERMDREPNRPEIATMLRDFRTEKFNLILGNTVASLALLQELQGLRVPFGTYVHELSFSLSMYASEKDMAFLATKVSKVFGVSEQVTRLLAQKFQVPSERLFVLPPIAELSKTKGTKTGTIKEQLGIPERAQVVLGCGMAEWRKGTDIFIRVARQVIRQMPDVHFVWLGVGDNVFSAELEAEKEGWDESGRLHLVSNKMDSKPYFEAMDVFFLSSREDPFPLVMLEAAFQAKPIVGFKGSGGVNDFLKEFPDLLVGYLEEDEAKQCLMNWLKKDAEVLNTLGEKLKNFAMNYSSDHFMARWKEMDI